METQLKNQKDDVTVLEELIDEKIRLYRWAVRLPFNGHLLERREDDILVYGNLLLNPIKEELLGDFELLSSFYKFDPSLITPERMGKHRHYYTFLSIVAPSELEKLYKSPF